jgi:hypothetical protein
MSLSNDTPTTRHERGHPHDPHDEAAHALPRWVNFLQDNLFLSFLILAEAYLLGTLMTLGWVPDIESPFRWGTFHGVGVVLFFLAGAMAAGVALRCSVAAASGFRRREWGFALFNFLGVVAFCGAEIWASLSERSANLHPTPADRAVLQLLGVSSLPVSPTIVVVALLLPFASLYYGFSQQQAHRDTEAERAAQLADDEAQLERKLLRARMQAQIRQAQAAGLAGALRAGVQAARGADPVPSASEGTDPSRSAARAVAPLPIAGLGARDEPEDEDTNEDNEDDEELAAMPRQRYSAPRITARIGASI